MELVSDPIEESWGDEAVVLSPGCTLGLGAAGGLGKILIPGPPWLHRAPDFYFKFSRHIR